jgi:hypothetical protein
MLPAKAPIPNSIPILTPALDAELKCDLEWGGLVFVVFVAGVVGSGGEGGPAVFFGSRRLCLLSIFSHSVLSEVSRLPVNHMHDSISNEVVRN